MKTCYIARSSAIAARMLDGQMIIMSAKDSTLFALNEVATTIWQAADGITPLTEIVKDRVCAQFDVDLDVALSDAETLVDGLVRRGILFVSEHPFTESATEHSKAGGGQS